MVWCFSGGRGGFRRISVTGRTVNDGFNFYVYFPKKKSEIKRKRKKIDANLWNLFA